MASDHNAMAAFGASLLGGSRPRAPFKPRGVPPSPSTPRSLPTPQLTTGSENTPPNALAAGAVPQVKITQPTGFTTANINPTSPNVLTERDTNNQSSFINRGPSLRGDAAALKEAREFSQSATTSGNKHRPSRSGRGVSGSGASYSSATSSMSRASVARDMLANTSRLNTTPSTAANLAPSSRPTPRAEPAGSPIGQWQNFSSLHTRPAAAAVPTPPTAAPQQVTAPPAPASTFKPQATATSATNPIASTITPAPTAAGIPASPQQAAKGAGLRGRQVAEINNTIGPLVNDNMPPHLRAKAAAAASKASAAPPSQPTPTPAPTNTAAAATTPKPVIQTEAANPFAVYATDAPEMTITSVMKDLLDEASSASTPIDFAGPSTTKTTSSTPTTITFAGPSTPKPIASTSKTAKPAEPQQKPATPPKPTFSQGTKADPIIVNGSGVDHPATPVTTPAVTPAAAKLSTPTMPTTIEPDKYMLTLSGLKSEVEGLSAKVKCLEVDNIYLGQKLEDMTHVDERRKFLGTDNAKVPYAVKVIYPHGIARNIQANKTIRISDLIRSTRLAAAKSSIDTQNPRIIFQGEQIGHGMTLGEAQIVEGGTVEFSYDGADEEPM